MFGTLLFPRFEPVSLDLVYSCWLRRMTSSTSIWGDELDELRSFCMLRKFRPGTSDSAMSSSNEQPSFRYVMTPLRPSI